jgi:hypothetical protein
VHGRIDFSTQAGLNLVKNGPYVVMAALSLTGVQHGGEVIYATDRRLTVPAGRIALEGQTALNPRPIGNSGPVASGPATFSYTIAWCSGEHEQARKQLTKAGYYWTRGGPTHPYSHRYRHYLHVDAKSEEEAIMRVRRIIEESGSDSADLGRSNRRAPRPESRSVDARSFRPSAGRDRSGVRLRTYK